MARLAIRSIALTPFAWNLGRRTASARRTWIDRRALLVRVSIGDVVGWGEAAPLPGFSVDDIETCRCELEAWSIALTIDPDDHFERIAANATRGIHSPAAAFALETALLDAVGKLRGEPAHVVLGGGRSSLAVAGLLREADPTALAREAAATLGRGIGVAKMKIGLADDAARLDALGGSLELRFDANQAWDAKTAVHALDVLARFSPELVEEPTRDWLALGGSSVPLAMDESLLEPGSEERLRTCAARKTCAAIVLKPMALGLARTYALARLAADLGLFVVVTHLFDGPIAAAATAEVALALRGDVRAAGLDGFGRAEDWPTSCTVEQIETARLRPGSRPGLGIDAIANALQQDRE